MVGLNKLPMGLMAAPASLTFVAAAHDNSPYVSVYEWDDATGFGPKLADPGTLPAGTGWSVAFNPVTQHLAVGHSSSPYISVYPLSAYGFGTKLSNPGDLPPDRCTGVEFTAAGDALLFASYDSAVVEPLGGWAWSSAGFGSRYGDPGSFNGTNCEGISISPDEDAVVTACNSGDRVEGCPFDSTTGFGTCYSTPTGVSSSMDCIKFSHDGTAVVAGGGTSNTNELMGWPFDETTGFGTRFSDPAVGTSGIEAIDIMTDDSYVIAVNGSGNDLKSVAFDPSTGFSTVTSDNNIVSGFAEAIKFSVDEGAFFIGHNTSPYLEAFAWNNPGEGSQYSDPATLPAGRVYGICAGRI